MTFFPPDVSLRVPPGADLQAAQALFPAAKQLLFRALNMKAAGMPVVNLYLEIDGALIYVYLIEHLKHVYVQPAVRPVVVEQPIEEEHELFSVICPDMLSGVVVSDGATSAKFHPTAAIAELYELDFSWQTIQRLLVENDPAVTTADTLQVRWPKPTMYSGAMKRVVQALYGIGSSTRPNSDDTGNVDFDAQNHYHYRWLKTDGVYRAGNTLWLIRIGKDDGVLAMELPVFKCSSNAAFAQALFDIGDLETFAVVDEFLGLPTGETFPTGSDLVQAIITGEVLQLLTVDEIAPFYTRSGGDKQGFFDACGWAFSNTGAVAEAHNTCRYYSRPDIALATWWEGGWYFDGHVNAPAEDRFMRCEHWKVTLALRDLTNADDNTKPGATLELVEMQPLEAPNTFGLNSYVFDRPKRGLFTGATADGGITTEEDYDPYGGGVSLVYPGSLQLGYGIGGGGAALPRTRFNTGMGFPAFGNWGAGDNRVLPWRPDITSDDGAAFHAVTGPGFLSSAEAPRISNTCGFYGFNPLDYVVELRSVTSRENPTDPANSHALFWTHSALMLVPASSPTSTLDRVTFWGRSQVSLPLDEMEPAYPAPVFVFFIGEDLEIVRRQAERWKDGQYTMGDFWATSLDLRLNSTYTVASVIFGINYSPSLYIAEMPSPEGHIGLIIPQGVREGYVFLRSIINSVEITGISLSETKPFLVLGVSGELSITELTNYEWLGDVPSTAHGDSGTYGLVYEVQFRWHWYWTSLYNNAQIKMSIAVNAQSGEFIYGHDGPMRDWNPFDLSTTPFFLPGGVVPPPVIPREGYPRYTTAMPTGIELEPDRDPTTVTFVGGI